MNFQEIIQYVDMTEPILVEWALNRIEDYRYYQPEKAQTLEDCLFDGNSIGYLINNGNEELLAHMFGVVSSKKFVNHVPALVEKWPHWSNLLAMESAKVVASASPENAAKMFFDYGRQGHILFQTTTSYSVFSKVLVICPSRSQSVLRMPLSMLTKTYNGTAN